MFDAKSCTLLLLAIVFETGYNMKTKGIFFKNIGTILIYAVFGATVSTLLTGGNGTGISRRYVAGAAVQVELLWRYQLLR